MYLIFKCWDGHLGRMAIYDFKADSVHKLDIDYGESVCHRNCLN